VTERLTPTSLEGILLVNDEGPYVYEQMFGRRRNILGSW